MTRKEILVFVVVGLGLRLTFFHGLVGSDDIAYIDQAHRVLEGERTWELHPHNQRHGIVYPTAALLGAGGGSFLVVALFPMILSIVSILVARDLGERLTGDRATGRHAAILLAVLPIHVVFSSQLYPDLPASALVAVTFWMMLGRGGPRRAFAAGLVLGWALLIKESMVVFLPFLAGWLITARRASLLPLAAGTALVLGVDMLAAALATGHPLFHLEAVRHGSHAAVHYRPLASAADVPRRIFLWFPGLLLDPRNPSIVQYGLTGLLAVAGLAVTASSRRQTRVPALWFLSAYLLYVLWPASLVPYVPAVPIQQRTLGLLSIPLCLLAAQAVSSLRRWRRGAELGLLGAAIVASLGGSAIYAAQYRGATGNARVFLEWLAEREPPDSPPPPIVTDPVNSMILAYLSGYSLRPGPFPRDVAAVGDHSLLFVDWKRIGFHEDERPPRLPEYVANPPVAWVLLHRIQLEPPAWARLLARGLKPFVPAARRGELLRTEPAHVYLTGDSTERHPLPESP